MSQAGANSTSGGGGGGTVDFLAGNSGGNVGPNGGGTIFVVGAGGITVTGNPGTNTLTITGGASSFTWNDVTTPTEVMVANNGYLADNAGLVTLTLPATAPQFSVIQVAGRGAGGWQIAQNAGQNIQFGDMSTTSGVTGYLASTKANDCVYLLCTVANTTFQVLNSVGNLTVN
jgi:hypothetical protein